VRQKTVYIPSTLSPDIFVYSLFCLKEISHPLSTMKSRIIHSGALGFWTMNKVQKPSGPECNIPSSEPFKEKFMLGGRFSWRPP
jgi:hypothetical protein